MFITTGIAVPSIKSNDCLEKNPAFFIENFSKFIIARNSSKYENSVCIVIYGPETVSFI